MVNTHPLFTQPTTPSASHNIWLAIEFSETNSSEYEVALTLIVGTSHNRLLSPIYDGRRGSSPLDALEQLTNV
jgi:hypothetical protein